MKSRPPLEVGDIFREFGEQYGWQRRKSLSTAERRVLIDIKRCRTALLGGHLSECDDECGYTEISYNSCRNRHCPKCQASARAKWFEAREKELLPVPYFHVIFTLPEEIRPIAFQNKRAVYGILFRAAAETLRQVARNPKHLGADIGFFGILHTWGQSLVHHPHVHFVIPGGGLSPDHSEWISAPKRFFLPFNVLRIVFRGKFLDYLEQAFNAGKLSFAGSLANLAEPKEFKSILQKAAEHRWAIQAKPPFAGPKAVLKYLARYTHRVAISNSRLISLAERKVTFRWKDYADHDRHKTMTLDVFEFIRRFLLHVLPKGFMRIRYYGFLASRNKKQSLQLCRQILGEENSSPLGLAQTEQSPDDQLLDKENSSPVGLAQIEQSRQNFKLCPACKKGRLVPVVALDPIPDGRLYLLDTT